MQPVHEERSEYFLCILESTVIDRMYIGTTADLEDRIARHNGGRSHSTKYGRPWRLVYTECFPSRSEAVRRERQLKGWKSKERLRRLVSQAADDIYS